MKLCDSGMRIGDIHSLLFADDIIICGQATVVEGTAIKTTIDQFC
jgi:hypothetical protein